MDTTEHRQDLTDLNLNNNEYTNSREKLETSFQLKFHHGQ